MPTTFTHNVDFESGAAQTFLAASLNSLANNAAALSAAYTVPAGVFELWAEAYVASFGGNVAAGGAFAVWVITSIDGGTNFEDGGSSVIPARAPDGLIVLRPGISTAQKEGCLLQVQPGQCKFLFQNLATGQAMASSGNTFAVRAKSYTSTAP